MIIIFITLFFNSLKKYDYSFMFRPSLFTIHYKKGHYSQITIPHPDPSILFEAGIPNLVCGCILGCGVSRSILSRCSLGL